MTIDELIERLEEYRDALGGDAAMRMMTQQNWPFENEIVGLASGEEMNAAAEDDDADSTTMWPMTALCSSWMASNAALDRSEPGRSRIEAETPAGASRWVVPAA